MIDNEWVMCLSCFETYFVDSWYSFITCPYCDSKEKEPVNKEDY